MAIYEQTVRRKMLERQERRIAELEAALDHLHMHAVEREYNWMMIPKTEWEQTFVRIGLSKSRQK